MRNLFPIILIGIAIGIFFFFGKPFYTNVQNLRAEVSQYNGALANSTELEKTRDSLLEIYNNKISPEEKARLDRFLPNTANNIELILEIQKITDSYNLPLKNIKFDSAVISQSSQNAKAVQPVAQPTTQAGKTESVLPYGIFNLEFETQGDFETFTALLRDLDRNLRTINIKAISFSPVTADKSKTGVVQNSNLYNFDLKVETYWLKN